MSTLLTDTLPVRGSTVDEALQFIDHGMKKTVESILETGYAFKVLQEACKRESKNFGETVEERYRINPTVASRWVKIGSKYEALIPYVNKLPTSYSTIYSLTTLPAKAFQEVVDSDEMGPAMTFEEAEKIKQMYKAEKEAKKVENTSNPFEDVEPFEESEKMDDLDLPDSDKKDKDIIEGDFKEVKGNKKKKLTIIEALKILDIDIDDAYVLAKKKGDYTDDELIEALAVIGGEL